MQLIPDVILLEHQKIENVNVAQHDASTSTAHQVYAQTPPYMLSYGLISSFLNNFFLLYFWLWHNASTHIKGILTQSTPKKCRAKMMIE